MTGTRRHLAVALFVGGCAAEPDGRLRLHADSDAVLCEGTRVDLALDVDRLADRLGLPVLAPIDLHYGTAAVLDRCAGLTGGCTWGFADDVAIAAANPKDATHELVHALRRQHGFDGPRSVEEGLAQILSGRPGNVVASSLLGDPTEGPAQLWPLSAEAFYARDPIYVVSTLVIDWLLATHGEDTVIAFASDPAFADGAAFTELNAAIPRYFDDDLDTLDERWRQETSGSFRVGSRCDDDPQVLTDPLVWGGTLDCAEDPDTLDAGMDDDGIAIPRARTMCVQIEAADRVRVRLDAPVGYAEVFAEPPCQGLTTAPVATVMAGDVAAIDVDACTWAIVVRGQGGVTSDWAVEVTRDG